MTSGGRPEGNSRSLDVAVIGGGLAGSAAAIDLARAGRDVVLFEACANPVHKVCGEFLSGEALRDLQALDVDAAALGAVKLRRVRLVQRGEIKDVGLPFAAMSLTRRTLDEALLQAATRAGVELRRPCRVTRLTELKGEVSRAGETWEVELASDATLRAREVVLATGKHDLPGRARPAGAQRKLLGLKMYYRLASDQTADLGGSVELSVYPGGYAGLQPVEGGAANFCCVLRNEDFRRLGGRWDAVTTSLRRACPHLDRRLGGAVMLLERPLAISPIPYGFVRRHSDGPWYVGDQAAVIPSFTGDGMSIALHSGRLAAAMLLRQRTADEFARQLHRDVAGQVRLATLLSRGLLQPRLQAPLLRVAAAWPGVLACIAKATRVRPKVMSAATSLRA